MTFEKRFCKFPKSGAAALAMFATLAVSSEAQAQQMEQMSGTLDDGTAWLISVPTEGNGVPLRDLDYAARSETEGHPHLLSRGDAFAGRTHHPLRMWQYDRQPDIHNL